MPAVDKIFVEVTADLRTLDRDMRAAEQRVDKAASTMQRSMTRGGRAYGSAAPMFGVSRGSEMRSMLLGGLTPVAAMMSLSRAVQDYQSGSMSGPGGNRSVFDKASAAVLDFTDALMKSIPIFDNFYSMGNRLYDKWMGGGEQTYANALDYTKRMVTDRDRASLDPFTRARGQYEADVIRATDEFQKRLEDFKQYRTSISGQDYAAMRDVAAQEFDNKMAQAQKRFDDALMKKSAPPGGVDSFGTVHGQFKVGQVRASETAMSDIKRAAERSVKAEERTAKAVERMAMGFVAFA